MATQIVPASQGADHHRPTAPLSAPAVEALARMEQAFAPRPAVLGRLTVERRSSLGDCEVTLDRVPVGVGVTVAATIAGLKVFPGRVRMILDDGQGGSALILIDSSKVVAAFRGSGNPPRIGARVRLHGVVTAPVGDAPKGIEAYAMRAVTA